MSQFQVGVSPHIRHEDSTRSIMLDVCIALLPALVWGTYVFGWRVLLITALSLVSSIGMEALFQWILRRPVTVGDGSAAVSGLLLALNFPVGVPLFLIPLGAFFAMIVVKGLFGGLGKNFLNPVLCARVILFVSFPAYMNRFTAPFQGLDGVSQATPLASLKAGVMPDTYTLTDYLVGTTPGCIGEVSSILLLAGFLYLLVRGVITWHVPVSFLGTFALLSFLFPQAGGRVEYMLTALLSGGLILGAVFMATDYVTSPVTRGGKLVYGVLCGALTVLFRNFGGYSEGVSFAILIMNLPVWYLDRLFRSRVYGTRRFRRREAAK